LRAVDGVFVALAVLGLAAVLEVAAACAFVVVFVLDVVLVLVGDLAFGVAAVARCCLFEGAAAPVGVTERAAGFVAPVPFAAVEACREVTRRFDA
jgi:hypothetical protein